MDIESEPQCKVDMSIKMIQSSAVSPRLLCKVINRDTSNHLGDKAGKCVIYMQHFICGVLCHNIQSHQDRHFRTVSVT